MYQYKLSELIPKFVFSLGSTCEQAIEECAPHMKIDFPNFSNSNFSVGYDETVCIITVEFKSHGIPIGGKMDDVIFKEFRDKIGIKRTFRELLTIPSLDSEFSYNKFILALDVNEDWVDWHAAQKFCMEWLNTLPLQRAYKHNSDRVLQAIPKPPQFMFSAIHGALWVLECEEGFVQGTGFDLQGVGTVTNHHVVNPSKKLMAFRADAPSRKYETNVLKSNSVLDLAIIKVIGGQTGSPLDLSTSQAKQMEHVAVCGFPNYRLGDTGVLTPGLIIGFRPKSGVQRLLTNAPIVAGMSGGPAIGGDGKVIGVCVNGAEAFRTATETEDHAIIPVCALEILE
jgi:hypothetical protein